LNGMLSRPDTPTLTILPVVEARDALLQHHLDLGKVPEL
jgi:hypothetical protein